MKNGDQKRNLNGSKDRSSDIYKPKTGTNQYRDHYYISLIETTK